ncbi:D-isomer specific 2-hydroxyacid dehydrogenase [Dichotomocladium elegans]|nr:D-isomer specific 2-hydroxyacid dehydrogenase [Dichotomocladium elegans]
MPFKVFVTRLLPPETQARLESLPFQLTQWKEDRSIPREELIKQVKGVDGLLCLLTDRIDDEILDAAGPQLKMITTMSVGYDHIDVPAVRARNIELGYTPDVLTDATADLTVLLTLAAARRMKEGMAAAANGEWGAWRPTWLCGSQFSNKTLGVVGMGRIGMATAQRLIPFGIRRVIYWGRREKPELKSSLPLAEFTASLDTLLEASDYVVVCCALTPETKDLFDAKAFDKMKKTAVFVNTARGGIVKQDDLVHALKEKKIAAAGLDVTTPEPLPPSHPLYHLPNCVILPHIASATFETRERMATMCVENVLAASKGEAIPFKLH